MTVGTVIPYEIRINQGFQQLRVNLETGVNSTVLSEYDQ